MHINCPHCHNGIEVVEEASLTNIDCPSCGSHFSLIGKDPEATQSQQTKGLRSSSDPGETQDHHTGSFAVVDPEATQEHVLSDPEATQGHAPKLIDDRVPVRTIGRFQLIREVGKGAFGSVWLGKDPTLDREVAVKVPRKGQLDAKESEQFFREARAAAQLKHPNIVPVHEIGKDGETIYIVSDFVKGVSLKDRLAVNLMGMRESSELCIKVAGALAHAHEKGVIHRDLKPANIMLDDHQEPYVMDFGLAKRETGEITMTMDGQILGTPAYMSPEQASGDSHSSDGRTDVYSIGVILFKMLTGELPFRGNKRMLIHQVINEEPPSPTKLNSNVDKDLATITVKCMQKDPNKRYAKASDLADDLQRYLDGKPIIANPVSSIERGWRWCKRKPALAGALATSLLLLTALAIGGPVAASYQASLKTQAQTAKDDAVDARNEAEDERDRANLASKKYREEFETSSEMLEVFTGAFAGVNPDKGADYQMTAKDVLIQAKKTLEKSEFEKWSKARMFESLTVSFLGIGEYDSAVSTAQQSLELLQEILPNHPDTLLAMGNLAASYSAAGRLNMALELNEKTLELRREKLGPKHQDTLRTMSSLAGNYSATGQLDKALELNKQTLKLRIEALGRDHPDTLVSMNNLANSLSDVGKPHQALEIKEQVLELRQEKLGPDHPDTWQAIANLGVSYTAVGRTEEALKLKEQAFKLRENKLGLDHPNTLVSMNNLVVSYAGVGRFGEALELAEQVLELRQERLDLHHPDTLTSMSNLANCYSLVGRLEDARNLREQTFKLREKYLGIDHPDTLSSMNNLANSYEDVGNHKQALKLGAEVVKLSQKKLGADHPDTIARVNNLGLKVNKCFKEAADAISMQQFEQSEELLQAMLAHHGPHKVIVKKLLTRLHMALLAQRKYEKGLQVLDLWKSQEEKSAGGNDSKEIPDSVRQEILAWISVSRSVCELGLEQFEKAETSTNVVLKNRALSDLERHRALGVLAVCLARQGEFDAAEKKAIEAYQGLRRYLGILPGELLWYVPRAAERVGKVYELAGKPDLVQEWKKKLAEVEAEVAAKVELIRLRRSAVDAEKINSTIWSKVARSPSTDHLPITPQELTQIQQVCEQHPKGAYHNTLAVAEFRMGNYEAAITAAKISVEKLPKEFNLPSTHPGDLAILAMSYHYLGEEAKAKKFRDQMEKAIEMDAFQSDGEAKSFAAEVKKLGF
jgi:serine/threonine protein kinase/Flp pilus assembly protein TadD